MSKLSARIRKKAKKLRKQSHSKSLTYIQNELATQHGYSSYKSLIYKENLKDKNERIEFAKSANPHNGDHFFFLTDKVEIYVRKDGRRGLRARSELNIGDSIFTEKPYLWVSMSEDRENEGLAWTLTRNILTKFPDTVYQLEQAAKFRQSFQPRLDSADRATLKNISLRSNNPESYVLKVYNLVCTYNVLTELCAIDPSTKSIQIGSRMAISPGLSYANHSCEPNAQRLTMKTIEQFKANYDGLQATQKISSGDEITWPYLPSLLSYGLKQRQKLLKYEFGFTCTCPRCLKEQHHTRARKKT